MPFYRLYHMSPGDGHIAGFDEFEAVNDEAALLFANGKLNAHPMELWEQHRKVARLEASSGRNHVLKVWSRRETADVSR